MCERNVAFVIFVLFHFCIFQAVKCIIIIIYVTEIVQIVVSGTNTFGGCMRPTVSVVFEELLAGTGTVYKRAVIPAGEECLLGFVEVDSEKHSLKTCLEAAAKDGTANYPIERK